MKTNLSSNVIVFKPNIISDYKTKDGTKLKLKTVTRGKVIILARIK